MPKYRILIVLFLAVAVLLSEPFALFSTSGFLMGKNSIKKHFTPRNDVFLPYWGIFDGTSKIMPKFPPQYKYQPLNNNIFFIGIVCTVTHGFYDAADENLYSASGSIYMKLD